jgi:hypothetical protein
METTQRTRDRGGFDRLFAALAHEHRRVLLYYLGSKAEGTTEDELSAVLAASTAKSGDGESVVEAAERASVELVHTHLPKLTESGIVTRDGGLVALTDEGRAIRRWLGDCPFP